MKKSIVAAALIPLLLSLSAPNVQAEEGSDECDISQTKCVLNDGKCNIKFRNHTGKAGGSDGGTKLQQTSSAQMIKITARKSKNRRAGNDITIQVGANNTMNIDKKAAKEFKRVRITAPEDTQVQRIVMSCEDVKAVLNGNGTCNVFHGETTAGWADGAKFFLGYQCDNGNVSAPR